MPLYAPDINPIAFSLGPIPIRWYSLAYIVSFIIIYFLFIPTAQRLILGKKYDKAELKKILEDIFVYSILGVIMGGRLGWSIFYSDLIFTNPLGILKVWEGGMSFHGGLVGVIVALSIYSFKSKNAFLPMMDVLAVLAPIGLFFGRIANFVNGELWGRPSDVAWAMIFKYADELPRHPSQLYEAALEGLLLFVIMLGASYMAWFKYTAGRLSALFLMGYGIARFSVEYFREPDAGLSEVFLGLTMGQSLTLVMFVTAFILIILSYQTKGKPHGE